METVIDGIVWPFWSGPCLTHIPRLLVASETKTNKPSEADPLPPTPNAPAAHFCGGSSSALTRNRMKRVRLP